MRASQGRGGAEAGTAIEGRGGRHGMDVGVVGADMEDGARACVPCSVLVLELMGRTTSTRYIQFVGSVVDGMVLIFADAGPRRDKMGQDVAL